MLLIGIDRSPNTRRVAITLRLYRVSFEQRSLSGFANRLEVRRWNPLGRIPALMLESGETLVDSSAIVDYLDEVYGGERPLTPRGGRERRDVLKMSAIFMGACDKALQAAYHQNHLPPEKYHQPWLDDCAAQVANALAAVEDTIDEGSPFLLLGRLTQADVTAFVAEHLARTGKLRIDTQSHMPKLRAITRKLAEHEAFASPQEQYAPSGGSSTQAT